MPTKDYVKIGRWRMSRSKFKKRLYWAISILIAFLFVSSLIVTILFGKTAGT